MNSQIPDPDKPAGGHLLANLLLFTRLLRQLNIPVSSYQVHSLAEALDYIDVTVEEDFYNASRSFLLHDISRKDQYDLAFGLFWSKYLRMLLEFPGHQRKSMRQEPGDGELDESSQQIETSLLDTSGKSLNHHAEPQTSEIKVRPVYSENEILRKKDFGNYRSEDIQHAKKIIREMTLMAGERRSRRKIRSVKKTRFLDFRSSIRNNVNKGGEMVDLHWMRSKYKSRQIIVLCDVSGSMEKYSQVFLYFLYAMVQETKRIEAFVFGTRLTRLTMLLRKHSVDQVIEDLSSLTMDWSGGTRIGESLKTFNYHWARRVKCPGSIVIIISDGWDRGNYELLEREISRLSRTAHRIMWLNPIAGSEDYRPLVKGMRTVLPYISDFYPFANLENIESLTRDLDLSS
jgi:uncharacterized protein with von Willebrand factor type A (vWA) domain